MWFNLNTLTLVSLGFICAQKEVLNGVLMSLRRELSFQTLLLLKGAGRTDVCWQHFDLDRYPYPCLNFDSTQSIYLKGRVSRRILALVCLDAAEEIEGVMRALGENLMDMRGTPVLLVLRLETNISSLFRGCFALQMLNVLALSSLHPESVYSYRAFPFLKVVRRRVDQVDRFFEPQVNDLQGYPIATVPYNLLPRSVIYRDEEGRRQMTGYLTHFYRNFARSLNASLRVRWDLVPQDETPRTEATAALLRDGLVDFPLVLTTLAPEPFYPSHVGEITSWFLMLPVEPAVPPSSLYLSLRGWQYFLGLMIVLALLLVNAQRLEAGQGLLTLRCGNIFGDEVLRAILAQSFVMPSRLSFSRTLLYSLLMMAGLIVSTFYSANLATLLVHPPAAFRILSYDDLRSARGKILISQQELPTLNDSVGKEVLERNLDTFEVTPSVVDFLAHRHELNTSFAYPVTNTLWPLLQLKQIRMHRPLFRRSHEITFTRFMPVTMPMARNSIYRDVFNRYLSRTLASGLYDLWFRRSFQEVIAVGKLNYTTDPPPSPYHDLVWADLYYVWMAYLGGTGVSILVLTLELSCSKWAPLNRVLGS
ncbi:uncharacterized protein LOC113564252 [Drosophila erecta]|uniref:uncharacterized protein LOC113564252 n=1 Tax=Drosophila erecta TaxID=7220 RepID=UPI0001781001|nr:uncharacterized protein LOC113564252 [Drosophila erecta]